MGLLDAEALKLIAAELDVGPLLSHREVAANAIRTALGRDPGAGPAVVLAAVQEELATYTARLVASDAARALAARAGDRSR